MFKGDCCVLVFIGCFSLIIGAGGARVLRSSEVASDEPAIETPVHELETSDNLHHTIMQANNTLPSNTNPQPEAERSMEQATPQQLFSIPAGSPHRRLLLAGQQRLQP